MYLRSHVLIALLLSTKAVYGRFVVEQGGIRIKLPDAARQKYAEGFDASLANFGSPKYGGAVVGSLIYIHRDYGYEQSCPTNDCNYGCDELSEAKPPVTLDKKVQHIILIDRGPEGRGKRPCKFALKVWNAQKAGVAGVIIVNYENSKTTMEAPNDEDSSLRYLQNITVPAAFVTKSVGDILKGLIKPTRKDSSPAAMVSMDWTDILPRSEVVNWEFWSNANDMCGPVCDIQKAFMKEFAPIAKDFQKNKWVNFTPHYLVWLCPGSFSNLAECKSQCIRRGRYCTPDPDGDLTKGYSGRDIVQENLRQLCVFQLANATGKSWLWWDYNTAFGEKCSMKDKNYNQECAEKVFKDIGGESWSSLAELRSCIGDPDEDKPSAILDKEMVGQRGDDKEGEVYILPTIRINEAQYRGRMSYTEVLRALCAGFNKNDEPAACNSVGEADCREGAPGDTDCRGRKDGKTMCKDTFAGYTCTCGSGFVSHIDSRTKEEVCLDINECLTTDLSTLEPDCACERCACKNTFGGYECIKDIKDECSINNGGCWQGDYSVSNIWQRTHFSACVDKISEVKDAAAHGKDISDVKLSECECPPCFKHSGKNSCEPIGDLSTCDQSSGQYPGAGGVHTPVWSILLSVSTAAALVAVAGYGLYRFRLRAAMHEEVRAIMSQYMPLQDTESIRPQPNGGPPSEGV